ncbi:hypothetical protein [Micromonospora sp. NPDC047738]|uniref:hypothetical protein n=1 Tax=unclassified Micromonospora TaxID=2617518 RepID=UPI0033EBA0B3
MAEVVDPGGRLALIQSLGLLSLARCVPLLHSAHFQLVDHVVDLVEVGPVVWNDVMWPTETLPLESHFKRYLDNVDWQETGLPHVQNHTIQLAHAMCDPQLESESAELAFRVSSTEVWAACDWITERSDGCNEPIFARLKTTLLGVEFEWQAADGRALIGAGLNERSYRDRMLCIKAPERYALRTQIAEAIVRLSSRAGVE